MLLENQYTIIPQIRFTLTYDNGVRKVITVKSQDNISCSYKKNGEKFFVTGIVTKIGCNFNSSLGAVGTTAFLKVDGSQEYAGQVLYIQPSQVLDLTVNSTSGITENIVCSVDNDDQRITLIRENEVGVFQYSLDGVTWRAANGAQGMSAYECACALGFVGTEEEWLASLKGEKGDPGTNEIYRVFHSVEEAECERHCVPAGSLVALMLGSYITARLYVRKHCHNSNDDNTGGSCNCGCMTYIDNENPNPVIRLRGYNYVGLLGVGEKGEKGDQGDPGKSAYEYAVEGGYPGTEDEFTKALARTGVAVTTYFMGPTPSILKDTVIGPIDLKVFGFTNVETFESTHLSRIDIYSENREVNQTLLFPEALTLRAVPTDSDAAKPNVTILGQKYVADYITNYAGQVGIHRRTAYIASYNGETIVGDWISSTGELDLGAEVIYTIDGKFEPFDPMIQDQYRKLHTYDNYTCIETTEPTYISIVYPIDITKYVATYVKDYLDEHLDDVLRPIVREVTGLEGETTVPQYVSNRLGDIPEDKTVADVLDTKAETVSIDGDTIPIDENHNIDLPLATAAKYGLVKAGKGISSDNGKFSINPVDLDDAAIPLSKVDMENIIIDGNNV